MNQQQHDCISRVRAKLMLHDEKIKYIRFKLSTISSVPSVENEDIKTGQAIEIGYHHKNKEEKTFIAHNYCPFCGKKYK